MVPKDARIKIIQEEGSDDMMSSAGNSTDNADTSMPYLAFMQETVDKEVVAKVFPVRRYQIPLLVPPSISM